MKDAERRALLIASGAIRPLGARRSVFTTDFEGRRVAARDLWFEEGPEIAAAVVGNPYADPTVRDILRRALARHHEAA